MFLDNPYTNPVSLIYFILIKSKKFFLTGLFTTLNERKQFICLNYVQEIFLKKYQVLYF